MSYKYKISLIGPSASGKSAIANRLVKDKFLERYDPTIEEVHPKNMTVEGKEIHLDIYDTAGTAAISNMLMMYAKDSDGFLYIASMIRETDLSELLTEFIPTVKEVNNKFIAVLCANKCDLKDDIVVNDEELKEFCDEQKIKYFKTSAKTGENIVEAFESLIKDLLAREKPKKKAGPCMLL